MPRTHTYHVLVVQRYRWVCEDCGVESPALYDTEEQADEHYEFHVLPSLFQCKALRS